MSSFASYYNVMFSNLRWIPESTDILNFPPKSAKNIKTVKLENFFHSYNVFLYLVVQYHTAPQRCQPDRLATLDLLLDSSFTSHKWVPRT